MTKMSNSRKPVRRKGETGDKSRAVTERSRGG
jgi:hypothetical protein